MEKRVRNKSKANSVSLVFVALDLKTDPFGTSTTQKQPPVLCFVLVTEQVGIVKMRATANKQ